ncbi:MAG: hypothetical protein H0T46_37420 [Deltaproteobacteria bacterium]|nr:hypothetical protein [Deltaproteobacteria bacterium]
MRRMQWVLVVGVVLAGCAYKAASSNETTREVRDRSRVGCLDVGVDRHRDLGNTAVVSYSIENHCGQMQKIDLGWAQVIGRTAEGNEVALVPAKKESSVAVAPHATGETTLAYPAPAPIGQLCIDIASLAQQAPAQWRCFGNPEPVALR